MTNKPKAIGTSGETGVVRALRRLGFPAARRLALAGVRDIGDVELMPGIVAEVKSGKAAKEASLAQIDDWWLDTLREATNYAEDFHGKPAIPLLIVQRGGYSPERAEYWRCHMEASLVAQLQIVRGEFVHEHQFTIDMTLLKATRLLRGYGYGEAL